MTVSTLPSRYTRASVPSSRYRDQRGRLLDLARASDPDCDDRPRRVSLYRRGRRVLPPTWNGNEWGTTGWIGYG